MVHVNSPVRKKKIIGGRMIWDSTDGSYSERLHEFFKYCLGPEDGYSTKEMIFITIEEFRTAEWDKKITNKGLKKLIAEDQLKLKAGITKIGLRFNHFRKWLENEALILINEKKAETGELIFYNIQSKKSLDEFERKRKRVEEAYRDGTERAKTIYSQGRRTRMQKADEESKVIALRNKRRNKRNTGDFGDGIA